MRELAVHYCPECGFYAFYQLSRNAVCPRCARKMTPLDMRYQDFMDLDCAQRDELLSRKLIEQSPLVARLLKPHRENNTREIIANLIAVIGEMEKELRQLEAENCPSLDRPADCFARILAAAAPAAEGEEARRALEQLLYHMGRTVYLLDAADDLEEDLARGGYNPVAARFALEKAPMPEAVRDELRLTLGHSLNALSGAYALLPRNAFSSITENIVYLGLPAAAERVLVKQTPEAVEAPGNTDNDTIGDKI